jgi:hypothetical protein
VNKTPLTPEEAESIFYQASSEEMLRHSNTYVKPVDQKECRLKGWLAVIEAIRNENSDSNCGDSAG